MFPRRCALCECGLVTIQEIRFGLCGKCGLQLNLETGNICQLCGKPLVSEKDLCLLCRDKTQSLPSYDRIWVIYPYIGKYKKLLSAYKFGKNLALGNLFTEKILEVKNAIPVLKDTIIVPVPPRPGKIKQYGWDQVDYLASKIKRNNHLIKRCLKRKKSEVQKRLNRNERMENLKGRIYNNYAVPENILLIDDVFTTGSTLEVCSSVLKEAGAKKVYGICLFYG